MHSRSHSPWVQTQDSDQDVSPKPKVSLQLPERLMSGRK